MFSSLIPHVFLPLQLPQAAQEDDEERATGILLCRLLKSSALAYVASVPEGQRTQWDVVYRMLNNVESFVDIPMSPTSLSNALQDMVATGMRKTPISGDDPALIEAITQMF